MGIAIWIGLGLLLVAFAAFRLLVPPLGSLADRAVRTKDLGPLIAAIQRKNETVQPTAYNHAIRRLWDAYHREQAIELIRELARNYGTVRIAQYWLQQVQQVEPKLAQEKLGKDFLATYYVPELAAQCGPAG
jgi:hypothetical protein